MTPGSRTFQIVRIAHDRADSLVNPDKAASGEDPKGFPDDGTADPELGPHDGLRGQEIAGDYLFPHDASGICNDHFVMQA